MSANQIPAPNRSKSADLPGHPRAHSCPDCWMNGGPGHTLALIALLNSGRKPTLKAVAK